MGCSRIGSFLILVGLVLLILFVGSVINKAPNILLLAFSLVILFFAYVFRRRPPQESGRFKTIRRIQDRMRRHPEEPEDEEQEQ